MKVRDAIRMIEEDGWYHVATRGSHRQFKHSRKLDALRLQESPPTTLRQEL